MQRTGTRHAVNQKKMDAELSKAEWDRIKSALSWRVRQLREEIIHTDDRRYRSDLLQDLERTEKLLLRLNGLKAIAA